MPKPRDLSMIGFDPRDITAIMAAIIWTRKDEVGELSTGKAVERSVLTALELYSENHKQWKKAKGLARKRREVSALLARLAQRQKP